MSILVRFYRCVARRLGVSGTATPAGVISDTCLRAACARLPEPARSVYLLSARDDLSFEQIAVRLDLSVATVEHELAVALFFLTNDDIAVTSGPVDR